jgi:ABC-type bacteriocin/lantibiotic exporter with double-glycine peptidase domain
MSGSSGAFNLGIRHQKQAEQNDCWATCVSMIAEFRGVSLARSEVFARAVDLLSGVGYTAGDMATLMEANRVAKRLTGDKVAFTQLAVDALKKPTGVAEIIGYLNKRQPLMITMKNHCWVVAGYDAHGRLLIHDVGKEAGPEPVGHRFFAEHVVDAVVLKAP